MAIGPCGLSAGLESHATLEAARRQSRQPPDARLGRPSAGPEHRLGQAGAARRTRASISSRPRQLEQHTVEALERRNVDRDLRRRVLDRPRRPHQPGRLAPPRHRQRPARLLVELAHRSRTSAQGVRTVPTLAQSHRRAARTPGSRCRRTWSRSSPRGSSAPTGERWYLTDGGHFENTACYELLRRPVPFIIASDNGQDAVLHVRGSREPRAQGAHRSLRRHPLPVTLRHRDDRRAVAARRDRRARRLPDGGGRPARSPASPAASRARTPCWLTSTTKAPSGAGVGDALHQADADRRRTAGRARVPPAASGVSRRSPPSISSSTKRSGRQLPRAGQHRQAPTCPAGRAVRG